MATTTMASTTGSSSMDDALDRMIGVAASPSTPYLPSKTWQGSKSGYYFGTSDQGTGYYIDNNDPSNNQKKPPADGAAAKKQKRKRITIDEGMNQVKSIPPRMSAEELLEQAEQEHSDEKILDVTPKGIQQALSGLTKLSRRNDLQRAKHSDDPEQYMESELALHQQLQAFSAVATQPQLFQYVGTDLSLFGELLTHDNTDIATTMMHVLVEWLEDPDDDNANDNTTHIINFAKRIVGDNDETNDTSILDLMIANLGRLENDDDDDEYQQGVEDVLTCVEQLVELELMANVLLFTKSRMSVAEYIAKETTLLAWLVAQLPKNHGRSAEILVLIVQQPALHAHVKDWTKLPIYSSMLVEDEDDDDAQSSNENKKKKKPTSLDALEILLQGVATFRKRQPDSATETLFLENIVLTMASALTFASNENGNVSFISQFLEAQGPELIVRCVKEKVHAGGVGLALLDIRDKRACEQLVAMGALKYLFPIFMGRSIPKPASSESGKKAKRAWLHKLEEHAVSILYNLTRYLSDSSPDDAKQRLLVKFLDHDKLDRLVELLMGYDERARKAEFRFYRYNDDDDEEEDDVMGALSAKLAGGGDLFHRIGAICAFVSVNSKRSHSHLMEQLTLQNSGIGLVKIAVQAFISVLADEEQKTQLQHYLEQI